MTLSRPFTFLAGAAVIPLTALVIAGCGGGARGGSTMAAPPKTPGGQTATVGVATTGLGKILVDSKGRTLYLFKKDAGATSTCAGACASIWPPLRARGKPTVGSGTSSALLGTTRRSDGASQVTYNGHPLYHYQGDENPGDADGQRLTDFGAAWYALAPSGNQISAEQPSSDGDNTNAGGGSGY